MERFVSVLWNLQKSINISNYSRNTLNNARSRPFCTKIPEKALGVIKTTDENTMDWLNLSHLSYEEETSNNSVEVLSKDDDGRINVRWDPTSGQFSFAQGSQLERAAEIVTELAETNPDRVAIIWRKDNPASEEMVTYRELKHMIEHVVKILEKEEDQQARKVPKNTTSGTLIYLPVSIVAVAAMLACVSLQRKHSLVFAGFSTTALSSLMETGQVECIITSDYWPGLTTTLNSVMKNWPDIETKNIDISCGVTSPSSVDSSDTFSLELTEDKEDLSPLFALYTGGDTSVIAGLNEEAGYYQVTSNVGLTEVESLPHADEAAADGALCKTQEEVFKEGKRTNKYRLDYIKRFLDRK